MIEGKTVLAIIPARGGSKGVPRKNIRMVAGKPLIAWSIEEAKKSKYIDRLIVSSEDQEIIEVARRWECEVPFVRPLELAQDNTPGIKPVIHALEKLAEKYDYVVLLQPTSPLRTVEDIDGCIKHCIKQKASSCVSVTESSESPFWMYTVEVNGQMKPLMNNNCNVATRQELPKLYVLNGAVYVANCQWLINRESFLGSETIAYLMPTERSLDVDSELDLVIFEALISNKNKGFFSRLYR